MLRAFAPSILGRLSLATSGLALVLLLEQSIGSFAVAGAATAILGVANVLATPVRARLIDRRGQTAMMLVLGLTHAVTLVALGLLAVVENGANGHFPVRLSTDHFLPLLFGVSALAGATSPPFGATMRVLWSTALPAGGWRTRAFSLDAVAEELTFALGPLLAAALVVAVNPFAALAVSGACVAVAGVLFVTSPRSRAERGSARCGSGLKADSATPPLVGPLRSRGFLLVVVTMLAPGVVLGAIELAAPATAAEESSTLFAGVLLAAFAGASALGGLVYGRLRLRTSLTRQLLVGTVALVCVTVAAGVIGGSLAALVGFTLSGLCLAPLLIAGYLVADERTDNRVRTEASSWINTTVNLGAALGAVAYGALTEVTSAGSALALTGLGAAVIIVSCAPLLLRRSC
ncbi:MFS transporter [Marisediminicola sp. LYQ134]|uniref:MFS transporter n=1 Tax=Marisediminicola sp. LYQ134 TaxID=3391061 RepID=UPI0039830D6E